MKGQYIIYKHLNKEARKFDSNLSGEQRKTKNKRSQQYYLKQKFGEEALKTYSIEVFDIRDDSFKQIKYSKAYTSKTFYPGSTHENRKGEEYIIHGKYKDETGSYYVISFTNSPYILTKGKDPANRNSPSASNLGYRGYGKYKQVDCPKEHQLWRKMVDTVSKREDVSIDASWLDFQIFCKEIPYIEKYNEWLEDTSALSLSPSHQFHYSLEESFFTSPYSTTLALGVIPTPKPFKDMGGEQECIGCENTFPFNSDYFTRAHRAPNDADLQPICKDCSKKDIQLRYYEEKTLGRTLSWEERKQQKLDKEKESEERKIKKAKEQEEKRLKKIERNKPKPEYKVCPGCDIEKEYTPEFFYKDKNRKWGLSRLCKVCEAEKNRKHQKKYRKLPHVKLHKNISGSIREQLKDLYKVKAGNKTTELLGCTIPELIEHFNKGEYTYGDFLTNTTENIYFHKDHIIPKEYYKPYLTFNEDGYPTEDCLEVLKKCWNYRNLRIWPGEENIEKGATLNMDLVRKYGIEDLLME